MKDILTVSQLNDYIKTFLEDTFGSLWVEGEVSNLRRPPSGHVYFTLKDDKSQIRAVYFRQHGYRAAKFDLEDGLKILCRARLSAYPPRGEYQLIVESRVWERCRKRLNSSRRDWRPKVCLIRLIKKNCRLCPVASAL
ncbi:MAG: hypothetical protein CVU51_10455 [Deltaproteobacteria bacterium HGW-Deltaproteobacteria-1]|nr:MAG: hypothetical protein CVU51_10455 [Deltaproteobacteria bacterium HGW-Deltaproteobacteria-1]